MVNINDLADRHDRLYERHKEFLGLQATNAISIVGHREYLTTFSGQVTWATLLSLVVRLYKGIKHIRISLDDDIERLPHVFFPNDIQNLRDATLAMLDGLHGGHVKIEVGPREGVDVDMLRVDIGGQRYDEASISVAGRGWVAFINDDRWHALPNDANPIGPIAAACLGTAQIYKRLYSARSARNMRLVFSAFDYSSNPESSPPLPAEIRLPKTFVPGAGAIGMGFLLTLQSMATVSGSDGLFVIDDDELDGTNLNRCLLAVLTDIGYKKLEVLERRLTHRALNLQYFDEKWQSFVRRAEHEDPRIFELVVSCVDKFDARKSVQYDKPPKVLLTAGTGDFLLTVSRHALNDGLACGLCYQQRERYPTCGTASSGTQEVFEKPIDPSIGFVSAFASVQLAAEYLKEIRPEWSMARLRNTARVYVLEGRVKVSPRDKDPKCNCSSRYIALGYEDTWGNN